MTILGRRTDRVPDADASDASTTNTSTTDTDATAVSTTHTSPSDASDESSGAESRASPRDRAPTITVGRHRARDGTTGGPVGLSVERPHAAVVVGKRGTGKSHTLAVLAEGVADAPGVTPTIVDPMGELGTIGHVQRPQIAAGAVPARVWPTLVGLEPTTPAGGLIWRAIEAAGTLSGACDRLADGAGPSDREPIDPATERVARNHLRRARRWDVFDPAGIEPAAFTDPQARVLDCSGLPPPAINAVCLAVARACYERRVASRGRRLPWLLVDEAHIAFEGVAAASLRRLFTRGRTPGVSVVCATQRPTALPSVAVSQADLIVAHALTGSADIERTLTARPRADRLRERLPAERGTALIVDDATETSVVVRVRDRRTPDGGASPTASAFADGGDTTDSA